MDLLLKPIKLWVRAVQQLAEAVVGRRTRPCAGWRRPSCRSLVIGGIPYERLWDWGFKQPPKQDLMGAVMDRAKQLDSATATTTWKTRSAISPAREDVDGEDAKPSRRSRAKKPTA